MVHPGGRPSKINDEICEEIVKYIKAGNYPEVAASLAGIDRVTFYRWIKKGARAESGIHKEFCNSVKKAEDYAEAAAVERIRKAGKDNWQALAWWMERKHPDKWGRKQRVEMEHSGEVKQEHKGKVDIEITPIDEFNRIMDESLDNLETEDTTPKE